jgi:LysR family transcriptional regulator, glycine cleavage system transcriptional activator
MRKRLPPLESLRILESCVRHASFTRAADEIGVTPAAISLRVRNLERELGVRLFERSGPRLKATAKASSLATRLADALSEMHAAVADCSTQPQILRVTAPPSFASRWLAPRLARYHRMPGSVPVHLDCSAELRQGSDFDVAIRTGTDAGSNFDAIPLLPIEATPMLSPSLAATVKLSSPADLAKLPLLPHDDWPHWFGDANVRTARLRFCADEYPTHELDAAAAMAGEGVALLSPTLFASALREGKLIQPFGLVLRGPKWHFLLSNRGPARPAVQGFRSWLSEELTLSATAAAIKSSAHASS